MSEPIIIRCPHCGRLFKEEKNTGARITYIVHHDKCGKFFRIKIDGKHVETEKV